MKSKKKIFKIAYCVVFILVIAIASLSTVPNTKEKSNDVAYDDEENLGDDIDYYFNCVRTSGPDLVYDYEGAYGNDDCDNFKKTGYCYSFAGTNVTEQMLKNCDNNMFCENHCSHGTADGALDCHAWWKSYISCDACKAGTYRSGDRCEDCKSGYYCEGYTHGMEKCPDDFPNSSPKNVSKGLCYRVKGGYKVYYYEYGYSGGSNGTNTSTKPFSCETIINGSLMGKINKNIIIPLRIIAPILLLILTTIDFAKIVFSENNKDGMPKAWKNFLRRAIATLIIFFAGNIVTMIYGFIKGVGFCWDFYLETSTIISWLIK